MSKFCFFVLALLAGACPLTRALEPIGFDADVPWLPQPNRVSWVLAGELPPDALVTAAYALVMDGDQFLVGKHRERGWDIPGGHVEVTDQSPAAAAARETFEESGVKIRNLRLYAYQKLEIFAPRPADYKYPYPVSYQAVYRADIDTIHDFVEEEDMVGRDFFSCEKVLSNVRWAARHPDLFRRAR